MWCSLWPVSVSSPWAEAQHQFVSSSTSGTLLLHLAVHIATFSPAPASSTNSLYSQILMQSAHSTPFQQFQVPFSVSFDPWSAPRLRSSLCVRCGSLFSGLVCSVLLAMAHYNGSFRPWLRQSHDVHEMKDIFYSRPLKVSIYSCQTVVCETLGWFSSLCFCILNVWAACGWSSSWCKLQDLFGFLQFTSETTAPGGTGITYEQYREDVIFPWLHLLLQELQEERV